ncbi:uncharacterized protein RCH25_044054 [Pelodytes ibericus]
MYGREAVFPCEVPVNLPLENIILSEETSYEGYFDENKSCLEDSKEKTSENMEKSQEKQKKANMKKVLKKYKNISYSVGNEVLLYNMRRKGRKGGRMEPDFFGPYTIMEICGKVVKLCTLDGAPLKQKINVDHIKPYIRSARTTAPKTQASSEEIITSVSSVPHRASVIHFATIKSECTNEFASEFILSRNLHEVKTSEEYISNARLQIACDLLQYKADLYEGFGDQYRGSRPVAASSITVNARVPTWLRHSTPE